MASAIVKGLPVMDEVNLDVTELKIIESSDLDRAWKSTVRERQKIQERRIWEDFCQNHDIIQGIYEEDPYQFVNDLPEAFVETWQQNEKSVKTQESELSPVIIVEHEDTDQLDVDSPQPSGYPRERDEAEPDKDETNAETGTISVPNLALNTDHNEHHDTEAILDFQSPCTVREITSRTAEFTDGSTICTEPIYSSCKIQGKSSQEDCVERERKELEKRNKQRSGNVESKHCKGGFEANVYFEKVKNLRHQINEVLLCIIELLQEQVPEDCDPIELKKMQKTANEFSARFIRIYVYQLQKQLSDLQRNMTVSLPFGRRTQFQAQAARVISIHQNTLQALQVFHRPLEKPLCLGDGSHLQALLSFMQEASVACSEVTPSQELKQKAVDMYNDEILYSCGKIERLMKRNLKSVRAIMEAAKYPSPPSSRRKQKTKEKHAKRSQLPYGQKLGTMKRERKKSSNYAAGARLSMYSLENMRLNLKSPSTRADKGTDKQGTSLSQTNVSPPSAPTAATAGKGKAAVRGGGGGGAGGSRGDALAAAAAARKAMNKKPLMRDNCKLPPTRKKTVPDEEIQTMVECQTNRSAVEPAEIPTPQSTNTLRPEPVPKKAAAEAVSAAAAVTGGACDVTALLRRLCGGGELAKEATLNRPPIMSRSARVTGARNAQLVCVSSDAASPAPSPRRPRVPATTPQLLKILEENIQKQPFLVKRPEGSVATARRARSPPCTEPPPDRLLLQFNIPEGTARSITDNRTQFVQYMLASPMYANGAFKKPWETVGRVSEQIIEGLLLECAREMEIEPVLRDLFHVELQNH